MQETDRTKENEVHPSYLQQLWNKFQRSGKVHRRTSHEGPKQE